MGIGKLIYYILRIVKPYHWLVAITLALTFIGALLAQVNAIVLDRAVDAINILDQQPKLVWASAVSVIAVVSGVLLGKELLAAVVNFFRRYYGERMRILVSRDLSLQVVHRMQTFRMAFFTTSGNEAGRLQSRIDKGVLSTSRAVNSLFIDILPLMTSAVLALILMFLANVYVGLVALLIVPVYFYVTYIQAVRMRAGRRGIFDGQQAVSQTILNIIESIGVVKSFNRQEIEDQRLGAVQDDVTNLQLSTRKQSYFYTGLKGFLEQIGTVLVIILTAWLVLVDYPGMTIGKIMYHVMLFANVSAPIRQLHRIYDDLNDALIYSERLFELLEGKEQVEDTGDYRPDEVRGRFELQHVEFTYPNGIKALHDVSMTIEPDKITALVGLSGAGKSTVVNLLDKFYHADSGTIMLDGTPLQQWDTCWLRDHVGLVMQKNHIFDGTIEENIRYGNPQATRDEVVEAARKAFLYDQVMQLPDGFQSSALRLSGGQQQRVAIARMFIKNPSIIILDEPTASLDAIATEQIKASIDAVKQGRTVIIISHNIGQIIDADYIYVLEQGRIVESGNPEDVYLQGGRYKEIFDASARSMNADRITDVLSKVK